MAWEVQLKRGNLMATDVLIYRKNASGAVEILHFKEDGCGVVSPIADDGSYTNPTLRIADRDDFLPALAKALSEAGIKLPDESHTQGYLKAQTEHLQDLRILLHLNEAPQEISHIKIRMDKEEQV